MASPNSTKKENDTAGSPEKKAPTEKFEEIIKSGSVSTRNPRGNIHCLSIIGQIEGHYALGEGQKATKYEHVIPLLVAIEEDPEIDGLLIILNTMGGDVEAGLALAEMIASMQKPTVSLVLGGGHSIGVPLAVAARMSFIVPSATMTIHPVRTNGLTLGVPQAFRFLTEMQNRITGFICKHSHIREEELRELMMRPDQMATDVGSIIDGDKAVSVGLIDRVGGLKEAIGALRGMFSSDPAQREARKEKTPDKNAPADAHPDTSRENAPCP